MADQPTRDLSAEREIWAQALENLNAECPTMFPVIARRVNLKHLLGGCSLLGSEDKDNLRFAISIHKGAEFQHQLHLLIHEWAHATTWLMVDEPGTTHNEIWGVAYAKAYQAVMRD